MLFFVKVGYFRLKKSWNQLIMDHDCFEPSHWYLHIRFLLILLFLGSADNPWVEQREKNYYARVVTPAKYQVI